MFNRAKRASPQKRIDCLIGAGTGVRGDVMFTGGLRVDGQISGMSPTSTGNLERSCWASMLGSKARSTSRMSSSTAR